MSRTSSAGRACRSRMLQATWVWALSAWFLYACSLPERNYAEVRDAQVETQFSVEAKAPPVPPAVVADSGSLNRGDSGSSGAPSSRLPPALDGGGAGAGSSLQQLDARAAPDQPNDIADRAPLGAECRDARECASNHCTDGVCCESDCSGQCQSCRASGSAGRCLPVSGQPAPGKPACRGDGTCAGYCDGQRAECIYPGPEVRCAESACADDGQLSAPSSCDGQGHCAAPEPQSCGAFACEGGACLTECRHDGHCLSGASCVERACVMHQTKQIRFTSTHFSPGGGIAGADAHCQAELGGEGTTWKALLVGGGRIASVSPYAGDGQVDWVLKPYTRYYNWEGRLLGATNHIALLGIANHARVPLDHPAWSFESGTTYPWSGYADDWTTREAETCDGWASSSYAGRGAFSFDDLTHAATEPCDRSQPLLCVEQ